MNSVALGLRELARFLDRLTRRLRLLGQRRHLSRLESRLGLLGWQQADYDSGTQRHVDRLTDFERDQTRLNNESATLGLTLQQLEERRTSERAAFERHRAERAAAREPFVGPVEEGDKTLAAQERERRTMEERIAALDRELASAEEKYRALLARGAQDAGREADVRRWQRRVISIPGEKQEWQGKLDGLLVSLPSLEIDVRQRRAQLAVETEALSALEKAFEESDAALAQEIAAHRRKKQKMGREIDDLEKAKTQPYREIGRALADQRIEPLNQPEALAAVLTQREIIAAQEAMLAASLEKSRRENRLDVWSSWLLLLTLAVLLVGGLWAVIRTR